MSKTKDEQLPEIGASAMASMRAMVAALECDYDRLEELRDERDAVESDAEIGDCDADSLALWDEEHGEELQELASAAGDCESREDAEQRIHDDALSVQVRSGWQSLGEPLDAAEFEILLTTGGPAVRILGELDENKEPTRAWLEVQDWGTPWTEHFESGAGEVLLAYARCFYFGN